MNASVQSTRNEPHYRLNIVRRFIGATIACAPVLIAIASIVSHRDNGNLSHYFALIISGISLLFAGLNFYLSFIRPRIYYSKNRTAKGYKFVSGLPVIGNIFSITAVFSAFGSTTVAIACILSCIFDTGGISWFVICTWKDKSFWDKEIKEP
ncbi:hypothetical protein Ga0100231_006220 [Opitutaceae bacterium TAV4]|nr:hypothetical protein Ga0100231_006220 [Opitutaceae bacterium TAV4]